jgi:transcriptional regulator of acetoin/glycerol metabolism
MKVLCPHCGQWFNTRISGRKPYNKDVIKVCDALRFNGNVSTTANKLGCSRAYIYKVMKSNGLAVGDFITKEDENGNV